MNQMTAMKPKQPMLNLIGCLIALVITISFPLTSWAKEMIYCPQRQGYIKIGMTEQEVISACGQPLSKQESNQPATTRVPVKQLIFTRLNQGSVYSTLDPIYDAWSLSSGTSEIHLEVDIVNQKVSTIRLNGSDTNSVSICQNGTVNIGDDESKVYNACGNADFINETYVNQMLTGDDKPTVWIYQINAYQQPVNLTFVDGKLQSIN